MHPVTKTKFGTKGVLIRYYNTTTSAMANGYIVKQTGTSSYVVSSGTLNGAGVLETQHVTLAQTATQVSDLGSTESAIATIQLNANSGGGTGATFTASYGLDASTTVSSGGSGWTTGDTMVLTGGTRPTGSATIATNPQANDTLALGGTTITFVASGASGNEVNIGGSAAATATALYTFLTGSADTNLVKCNYAQVANVINIISKTTGTANNAFGIVPTSGGRITASAATLTGGVADTSGVTPPTVTAKATSGAVTGVTITAAGTYTTTFPTNPVNAYFNGNGHMPAKLTQLYKLASVAASGGTGYVVGEALVFNGMTDTSKPQAHVSTVSSGAATAVVVDSAGAGIGTKASSIGSTGPQEHVRALYETTSETVEGHRYVWSLGASVNGSAIIDTFS